MRDDLHHDLLGAAMRAATEGMTPRDDAAHRAARQAARRRRSLAVTGAVLTLVGAVPVAYALAPSSAAVVLRPASRGAHPITGSPDWHRRWPVPSPGSACPGSVGKESSPHAFPELLLLPKDTEVDSAFVNEYRTACPGPHNALVLQRRQRGTAVAGLVLTGPNAPSVEQSGRVGQGVKFLGRTGNEPVQGSPAVTFSFPGQASVLWTGADGAQWQADSRGLTWQETQGLLNRLHLDAADGIATLPPADEDGWQALPTSPDPKDAHHTGVFFVTWRDHGMEVNLAVRQQPRLSEYVTLHVGAETEDVNGHPATYYPSEAGTSSVVWAPADGVFVDLALRSVDRAEVLRIARSLRPADVNDPRLRRPVEATPSPTGGQP